MLKYLNLLCAMCSACCITFTNLLSKLAFSLPYQLNMTGMVGSPPKTLLNWRNVIVCFLFPNKLTNRSVTCCPELLVFFARENGLGGANENFWILFYTCTRLKKWFWYIRAFGGKIGITACCQITTILG